MNVHTSHPQTTLARSHVERTQFCNGIACARPQQGTALHFQAAYVQLDFSFTS